MSFRNISITLIATFLVGNLLILKTKDKFQMPHENSRGQNSRDPAAIRPNFDFSQMDGSKFVLAAKERLVSGTRILKRRGSIGVELGHFVLRGPAGQKIFACEEYSQVKLVFEGDGTLIDGKKPLMEIESPCSISSNDVNRTSPIWIPAQKILEGTVQEGEFVFGEKENVKVKFSHVYDQWPTLWALREVELSRDGEKSLVVSQEEVSQFRSEAPILDFAHAR